MARPHIEFIEVGDVEQTGVTEGPLTGSGIRMLSEDDESGAFTAFSSFSSGWTGDLGVYGRPVEVFVVRGELELDGQRLAVGCYGYVPSGSSGGGLAARSDGQALVMVDPERPREEDAPVKVLDEATMQWESPAAAGDVPQGILIKVLRVDEETADWTWVASCIPGWQSPEVETHPTVEECLMLRGDILCGDRGGMTAGSYFWRPGMVKHGPMCSRNGGFFFFRTKGGDLTVDFETVPGWEEMFREYHAEEPFYGVDIDG
jgi:hypothetical protein